MTYRTLVSALIVSASLVAGSVATAGVVMPEMPNLTFPTDDTTSDRAKSVKQ